MLNWIARHSAGWEYFIPLLLLSSVLLASLLRSGRTTWAPWSVILPWIAMVFAIYIESGVDRFWYYAKPNWFAYTGTLIVVCAIPFVVAAATVHLPSLRRAPASRAGLFGALAGILAIPLAGVASVLIAVHIVPLFRGS
jgi:hypothetical protein